MKKINKIIIALLLCTLAIGCENNTFKTAEDTKYMDEAFNNEFYLEVLNEDGEEQPEISKKFLTMTNSLAKTYKDRYCGPGRIDDTGANIGASYKISNEEKLNGVTYLNLPSITMKDKLEMYVSAELNYLESSEEYLVSIGITYISSETISDPEIIFKDGDLEKLFNLCTEMNLPQNYKEEIGNYIVESYKNEKNGSDYITYKINESEENDKFEVIFTPIGGKDGGIYFFTIYYYID